MANPLVVPKLMKLYAPFCPEGRMFQRGEEWPGEAWSANPKGKDAETENQLAETNQALIEAHDELERLEKVIEAKDFSLAQLGKERDDAVAEAKSLKQRTLDAEAAQKEAEAVASEVTKERDRARAELESLRREAEKTAA